MAALAILTAFSTASAPELNNTDFLACVPGVSRFSASHTATYPSYGVTMKQVWVNDATWADTLATTESAALPTLTTAMPEPKSISELPSTSTMTPPPAAVTKTGSVIDNPFATALCLRASNSCERGPGIAVTRRRSCGSDGPPVSIMTPPPRSPTSRA